RILQESLSNAIKHSRAQRFEALLRGKSGEIELTVRDNGKGFDVEEAMKSKGLGLVSMRERVSMIKGEILIASQLDAGTEIKVRIPLMSVSEDSVQKISCGAA